MYSMIKRILFCFILLLGMVSGNSAQNPEVENEETGKENEKGNVEKNFLELSVNYINEKNFILAKRYLEMAEKGGDEQIYQEAQLWKLYIESLEGNKNLETGLSALSEDLNAKGLYLISEGWQSYYEKNPEVKDIYALSLEYKEKLITLFPDSEWATLASMQLVTIHINQKDYDKALLYLIKYFDIKKNENQKVHAIDDKAWFYMGQILENSREYRDLHKAVKAYYKVMENPESLFYTMARNRISALEKFYHVIP